MPVHPSLTQAMDIDGRVLNDDLAADLRRSFLSVGPVRVRPLAVAADASAVSDAATGAGTQPDGETAATDAVPITNVLTLTAHTAKKYWLSSDDGADAWWPDVVSWLQSKEYFVGTAIANFNKSRAKEGGQTISFHRLVVELGPIALELPIHNNTLPDFSSVAGQVRTYLNNGAFGDKIPARIAVPLASAPTDDESAVVEADSGDTVPGTPAADGTPAAEGGSTAGSPAEAGPEIWTITFEDGSALIFNPAEGPLA